MICCLLVERTYKKAKRVNSQKLCTSNFPSGTAPKWSKMSFSTLPERCGKSIAVHAQGHEEGRLCIFEDELSVCFTKRHTSINIYFTTHVFFHVDIHRSLWLDHIVSFYNSTCKNDVTRMCLFPFDGSSLRLAWPLIVTILSYDMNRGHTNHAK